MRIYPRAVIITARNDASVRVWLLSCPPWCRPAISDAILPTGHCEALPEDGVEAFGVDDNQTGLVGTEMLVCQLDRPVHKFMPRSWCTKRSGCCDTVPFTRPIQSPVPRQLRKQMKYMLQVRFNGADTLIGTLPAEEQQKVTAEFQVIRQFPGVLDGNQLAAAGTAATVRVNDGTTQVTEGPAVGAGTELDGYYIYDAPDLDAAIAFAARIPVARMGGTVEVREMVER